MSRPAIVGNRLFVRPKVFDLRTGLIEKKLVPAGGCGTYAATSQMLVYRAGNVTLWDFEQDKASPGVACDPIVGSARSPPAA